MKKISSIFLKGLFTLLPLLISIYALTWFLKLVESFARNGLLVFWPDGLYVPGMGVAVMVVIIFAFGIVVERPYTRWMMRTLEGTLSYVPLLKTVYLAIKDFTEFLQPSSKKKKADHVVVVKFPGVQLEIVGLLTREDLRDLPNGITKTGRVAVYIPISYQLGGYTVFVPREYITPLDMGVEQAMRSIVTAWLPGGAQKLEARDENPVS
jgi:uncharacterized membrane protein